MTQRNEHLSVEVECDVCNRVMLLVPQFIEAHAPERTPEALRAAIRFVVLKLPAPMGDGLFGLLDVEACYDCVGEFIALKKRLHGTRKPVERR